MAIVHYLLARMLLALDDDTPNRANKRTTAINFICKSCYTKYVKDNCPNQY